MLLLNVNEMGTATVIKHLLKRSQAKVTCIDAVDAHSDIVVAALHEKRYKHVVINCIDGTHGACVAADVLKHFPEQSVFLVSSKRRFGQGKAFSTLRVVPDINHVVGALELTP